MTTKNLIPRASGEGKLGVRGDTNYLWKEVNAVSGSFEEIINNDGNSLLNAGTGVAINYASGSSGFQYTISATAAGFADKIEEGQAKVEVVDTVGVDDATIQFWADPSNLGVSEKIWEFDKDGYLIPDANATYDIGKADKKVRHLFLDSNSLHIGTTSTVIGDYATGGTDIHKLGKNSSNELVWNSNGTESIIATLSSEQSLHVVATSGLYSDLTGNPTIPDSSDDITSDRAGINYSANSNASLTAHLAGIDTSLGNKVEQSDIDAAVQGLDVKDSVRVATTGVLTGFTYANSSTQQWQEDTPTGALSIDGVVLVDNDRVLVKDASAATQNGIYIVSGIDGSSQVVLDRAEDLDNGSDFRGVFTFVEEGNTNITRGFVAKNTSTPTSTTVGTNTQNWSQFSSAGSVSALNDLTDVSFTAGSAIDNYVLTYDQTTTSWGAEAVPAVGTATESISGIIEIATDSEAAAATADNKALVPSNISSLDLAGMDNTTSGFIADIVTDTTPQLGGSLDVSGHDIVSVSDGDIEVDPHGIGSFKIKGNATSGSGRIVLNCEQNSHGITLKGPPHSATANYTLTFPNDAGTSNQVLQTNGSGVLSWASPAAGISSVSADTSPELGGDLNVYSGGVGRKIKATGGSLNLQAAGSTVQIRLLTSMYTPLRVRSSQYSNKAGNHIYLNGNVDIFPAQNDPIADGQDANVPNDAGDTTSEVHLRLGSKNKSRLGFGYTSAGYSPIQLENDSNSYTLQLNTYDGSTDDSPTFDIYGSAGSAGHSGELRFSRHEDRFTTSTTTIGEISGKSRTNTEYARMQLKSTNGEGAFNFDVRTGTSLTTALEVYSNASNNNIVKVNAHDGLNQGLMLGSTLVTATAAEINLLDGTAVSTTNGNVLTYNNNAIAWLPASGGGTSRPAVSVVTAQTTVTAPGDSDVLEMIFVYNSTNAISTTLPDIASTAAIDTGFKYQLKNINTGAVTVDAASGEYIDHSGQTSVTINQYDNYTLTTDGSNWYII